MVKTLTPVGDGLGLLIDRSILERLGIDRETTLELTVEEDRLVIRPVAGEAQDRFVESARRMMEIHGETFRKLAE
jgi:antitoxin component of MazEF toxin-antitoxin module